MFIKYWNRCVASSQRNLKKLICLLVGSGLLLTTCAVAAGPMLPSVYTPQIDVAGWLMSEKLDGVRGYWNGQQLLSKNGHLFYPPAAFIRDLPPFPLEGEIWGGRGSFERTVAIVKHQQPDASWRRLKFAIFDVPQAPGGFHTRIARANRWFSAHPSDYAFVIPQITVRDKKQLQQKLRRVEGLGGEGLIVRKAEALYHAGRSSEILKVKSYRDAEATVIAQLPGKGRNKGRLGALLVKLADGTEFKLGGGFSDAERKSPPAVGTVITFKYYGKHPSGIPRFASFLRIRKDLGL